MEFGGDLDIFNAIFIVLGTMPYNHILKNGGNLFQYLFHGGNLYMEGSSCFYMDIEGCGGYNVRPWFSLSYGNERIDRDYVYWVDGINGLAGIQNLQNTGINLMMDDLPPVSSTPILQNHDTGDTLGVWWDGFGPNNAKTIGVVPAFGSLVDTSGSGYKELLMYKYLEFFDLLVGVDEEELQATSNKLQVFPNPCEGAVRLRYQISDIRFMILDLYSIEGMRIKRLLNEEKAAGMYELEVDMSDLPAGIYFCILQSEDRMETVKVVKY